MTVIASIEKFKKELGVLYSIEERDQIIATIFEALTGMSKIDLRMKGDLALSKEILNQFEEITKRLIKNEPV